MDMLTGIALFAVVAVVVVAGFYVMQPENYAKYPRSCRSATSRLRPSGGEQGACLHDP